MLRLECWSSYGEMKTCLLQPQLGHVNMSRRRAWSSCRLSCRSQQFWTICLLLLLSRRQESSQSAASLWQTTRRQAETKQETSLKRLLLSQLPPCGKPLGDKLRPSRKRLKRFLSVKCLLVANHQELRPSRRRLKRLLLSQHCGKPPGDKLRPSRRRLKRLLLSLDWL